MWHVGIGYRPWWEPGNIFCHIYPSPYAGHHDAAGLCFYKLNHYYLVNISPLLFPNCLSYAHIILMADVPQSISMSHYTGSLCLSPKQSLRFRACVCFTGQLTLGQYMILPNKPHVGEHCNYYSSMAQRTVGQLWGTTGYVAMW